MEETTSRGLGGLPAHLKVVIPESQGLNDDLMIKLHQINYNPRARSASVIGTPRDVME